MLFLHRIKLKPELTSKYQIQNIKDETNSHYIVLYAAMYHHLIWTDYKKERVA